MRFKTLTVAAAAAGALAVAATPASAAPNWQTVSTNSNWTCTAYHTHSVSDYVKFKACEVINANNDAQVVLVVQSTASVAVSIGGSVNSSYGSTGTCTTSTLNPGFTRGCYGSTVPWSGTNWWISATLTLNGVPNTIVV